MERGEGIAAEEEAESVEGVEVGVLVELWLMFLGK